MKSKWPILGLGLLWLAGCARISVGNSDHGGVDAKVTVSRQHEGAIPAAIQKLYVENRNGPVVVTGVEGDFGWRGELKCHALDERTANEFADRCRLEATENDGAIRLLLRIPEGDRAFWVESDLRVRVPRSVAVEVINSIGATEVSQVRQAVRVRNQSGRILLASLPGEVDAATTFAAIQAEDIGPAKLHNQSGGIDVSRVAGDLVAATSFGALSAREVKGTVELANQSGSITAGAIAGELKARTSFGGLRILDTGPAYLANQSGGIAAARVAGNLDAATSFAPLTVEAIQGEAKLVNQSGAITAAAIRGALSARTSFARMRLSGTSSTIHARNESGAIEIIAASTQTTRIDAATTFSPLDLRLRADAKPLIRAHTTFGEVHSEFPVIMKSTLSEEQFAADPSLPKVSLQNQSADIRIARLSAPK